MANRFPLVLDTTDGNKIKELPSGDNLNLRENSIINVQNVTALGTIDAADVRVGGQRIVAQNIADLTDTPSTYSGSENYFVKVNSQGTGLEYRPLSDIGSIGVNTLRVGTAVLPDIADTGVIGTDFNRFLRVTAKEIKGDLISDNEEIVFDASTGKISYAALQGAPQFLSEFTDDIGYLRSSDLDNSIAGLFDEGRAFESDLVGSVFADDSTLLVDGLNGKIVGDIDAQNLDVTNANIAFLNTALVTANFISGVEGADFGIRAVGGKDVVIGASGTTNVKIHNPILYTPTFDTGLGTTEWNVATNLDITAGNRVSILGGVPFRISNADNTVISAIGAANGDLIYNTSTNTLQTFQNGAWVDVTGNVSASSGTSNFNNVIIAGDLTVSGTTTTVDTTNTTISDNTITLNNGETLAGVAGGTGSSGIEIDRGTEASVSLIWDETLPGWTVGSQNIYADQFRGNDFFGDLRANSTVQIDGDNGLLLFEGLNSPEIRNNDSSVRLIMRGSDYAPGTAQLYVEANNVWLNSSLTVQQGISGDLVGSVFADDSAVMVDAVNNILTAGEVITPQVSPIVGGSITIGGTFGSFNYSDSNGAIQIASSGTVNVEGAASSAVNIGTGTSGTTTIGHAGNVVAIPGTLDLGGATVNNAGFDLTGNIDNTNLTVGATATTVAIGHAGSTTTINGTVSFASAIVANNITADDSIVITTAVGAGNGITLSPQGTNTTVNLQADGIRTFGSPFTDAIVAQAGVTGDVTGSIFADDSSMIIDGVAGAVVGDVNNTNITTANLEAGTAIKTASVTNDTSQSDLTVAADGFMFVKGGELGTGTSEIQLDKNGINNIEIKTVPGNPSDPTDYARVAINANTDAGDVRIGTPTSTRNQKVEIYNAEIFNPTLTGGFTGDITGSVFADDSTLLVDGVNGTIPWSVITGFTGGGQEEYDVFATSLSSASSANVTAGSYFRNEADTADIAVSASVTSGFSKMKVMLSANIHNPINTNTEAVVRLERSVNGGAGTTIKRFVFPAGSNYYGGVEFMFVDDHGQSAGSLIEYKLVNDMSNGYSGEDLRMWYGISGDTFGLKELP